MGTPSRVRWAWRSWSLAGRLLASNYTFNFTQVTAVGACQTSFSKSECAKPKTTHVLDPDNSFLVTTCFVLTFVNTIRRNTSNENPRAKPIRRERRRLLIGQCERSGGHSSWAKRALQRRRPLPRIQPGRPLRPQGSLRAVCLSPCPSASRSRPKSVHPYLSTRGCRNAYSRGPGLGVLHKPPRSSKPAAPNPPSNCAPRRHRVPLCLMPFPLAFLFSFRFSFFGVSWPSLCFSPPPM